jgi:multidrug efflux pump subunit AcrA (membrane-fusion protein)
VKVGESRGNRLGINEGLKEGDKVITEGYQKVGEGSPVEG